VRYLEYHPGIIRYSRVFHGIIQRVFKKFIDQFGAGVDGHSFIFSCTALQLQPNNMFSGWIRYTKLIKFGAQTY